MGQTTELEHILNQGFRYALSLTTNEDDAYDLVQNSYLKILEKNKPMVIAYLIRTVRNGFIDKKRKDRFRLNWFSQQKGKEAQEPNYGVEPYLEKILNNLPDKKREIIFLAIVQEYTAQEIADLMEIPRGTVLSILHRTKKELREKMQEQKVS